MKKTVFSVIALSACLALGGCASKKYVDHQLEQALTSEIGNVRVEMDNIRQDVKANQGAQKDEIEQVKVAAREQQERMDKELGLVQEALKRASDEKRISKGKLLYEVTISDESVQFAYDKAKLSEQAKKALDIFANVLIKENEGVYIEIQGHTDNIGSEEYNYKLGLARAEAVRNYLHTAHNLPLHHMSSFSYGETEPAVSNDTRDKRAQNRRVMLIVME